MLLERVYAMRRRLSMKNLGIFRKFSPLPAHKLEPAGEGDSMDAYGWSAGIQAAALAMAENMTPEQLTLAGIVFTQLGTTLSTIAAIQNLGESSSAQDIADLSGLR